MTDDELAEARKQWEGWVKGTFGGPPAHIAAATDAAIVAIGAGATQAEAADAARAAWQAEELTNRRSTRPTAPTETAASPRPSPARGRIRGQVAGFQQRNELLGRRYLTVWNFRVERTVNQLLPLSPVSVEMRAFEFEGALADGDEVEITGTARPRQIIHVRQVENLTSNSVVRAKRGPPRGAARALRGGIKLTLAIVVFALIAAAVITLLYIAQHNGF